MRRGVRQLAAILAGTVIILLGYAVWRRTAAAWIGMFGIVAALASLVAVHLPDPEDEAD